jgi:hypothetical protein
MISITSPEISCVAWPASIERTDNGSNEQMIGPKWQIPRGGSGYQQAGDSAAAPDTFVRRLVSLGAHSQSGLIDGSEDFCLANDDHQSQTRDIRQDLHSGCTSPL